MTTLLEASQALLKAAKLSVKWRATGIGRPTEQLMMLEIEALEQAIAQELASQTASTNPVVPKKTAETVDKDCGNCKKFSTNSLTGGPVCISCKDYSNWEPKP
jgi:hypothetical protein